MEAVLLEKTYREYFFLFYFFSIFLIKLSFRRIFIVSFRLSFSCNWTYMCVSLKSIPYSGQDYYLGSGSIFCSHLFTSFSFNNPHKHIHTHIILNHNDRWILSNQIFCFVFQVASYYGTELFQSFLSNTFRKSCPIFAFIELYLSSW